MAHERVSLSVERVGFEGQVDPDPSGYGYNMVNGLIFAGELPRSGSAYDFHTLSGSFSVRSSTFRTLFSEPGMEGFVKDGSVAIGGSPHAGNVCEDVLIPILMGAAEGSVVDVSHNRATGLGWYAYVLMPPMQGFSAARPSLYFVHQNRFTEGLPDARGIDIVDDPASQTVRAVVFDNQLGTPGAPLRLGINLIETRGALVFGNRISGIGGAAVIVQGSTRAAILGNDVSAYQAVYVDEWEAAYDQIFLDDGTTDSRVVCRSRSDSVTDLGTGNRVIGCR